MLEELSMTNLSYSGDDEVCFSCPRQEHAFGDRTPSAYMNLSSSAWFCHSCGASGNALSFLADLKDVSRSTAYRWLCERWAPQSVEVADLKVHLQRIFNPAAPAQEVPLQVLPESELESRRVDWFAVQEDSNPHPALDYLFQRGFSSEALTNAEICHDFYSDRPCITVRDEEGNLVGFKSRGWRPEEEDPLPRYWIIGDTQRSVAARGQVYGFSPYDASQVVYGLHDAESDEGRLLVAEGEANVIALREMGFANAVAPSGSTLSKRQVDLIVSRATSVVIFWDYDLAQNPFDERQRLAEERARVKVLTAAAAFEGRLPTFVVGEHRRDPADTASRSEVAALIDDAVSSTRLRLSAVV